MLLFQSGSSGQCVAVEQPRKKSLPVHNLNVLGEAALKLFIASMNCILGKRLSQEVLKMYSVCFCVCFQGGKGQIKQKKKTVPQKVTIAKIPRAKKKYVTRVCGLATFGQYLFHPLF